jgi:hypothetical protein
VDSGKRRRAARALGVGLVPHLGSLRRLLVVARARDEADDPGQMPWPLTRAEIELFISYEMSKLSIVDFFDGEDPPKRRWKAWFTK